MLRNNQLAPLFTLKNTQDKGISLSEYSNKPVVLLFFRGKFCPTTDRYLTAYQDFYARIKDLGMELLAISSDSIKNHLELKVRLGLDFELLSNPDLKTLKSYELYIEGADKVKFCEPAIYILDKDSKVAYSVISSGPKGLPNPADLAPVLIYMQSHGGKY